MISNFPAQLQPLIQQGFLARRFERGLRARLGYRAIAERVSFPTGIGETVTKTKPGLKAPVRKPIPATANVGPDNGIIPTDFSVEQYSMTINMYGGGSDLNVVTSRVGLGDRFMENARVNGAQAAQSMDLYARDALFAPYMSGNSRVIDGSAGTSVHLDDVRGFGTVHVNGVVTPVSGARPLAAVIGNDVVAIVGVAPDVVNVSTTPEGVSGVLTLAAAASVAVGDAAVTATASRILRPNAKATSKDLVATDRLTMSMLLDANAEMEANNVPKIAGFYNLYLDPISARQLFADPDFKNLSQGVSVDSPEFQRGELALPFCGARLVKTTEAYQERRDGITVRRPILCGEGALVEGTFDGMADVPQESKSGIVEIVDDVAMVTTAPEGRLLQTIKQSWYWIGGYSAPSDTTASPEVIGTASNAAFKRATVLEHAG